jgi:hypothetical protein
MLLSWIEDIRLRYAEILRRGFPRFQTSLHKQNALPADLFLRLTRDIHVSQRAVRDKDVVACIALCNNTQEKRKFIIGQGAEEGSNHLISQYLAKPNRPNVKAQHHLPRFERNNE